MKSRISTLVCFVAIMSVLPSCGGGGGGGGTSGGTQPVATTTLSHAASKTASQKSVAISRQLMSVMGIEGQDNMQSSARMPVRARQASRAAASTYNNEYEPDTGCILNGYLNITQTSATVYTVAGSITKTDCDDDYCNGTYTYSGNVTQQTSTTAYFNVKMVFAQSSSSLEMEVPMVGTYESTWDTFTPASARSLTVNGTDRDSYTYTSLTLTETADGGFTVTGSVKDSSNFSMTFSNSKFNSDGSATLRFSTNADISGTVSLAADGSGTATYTQTSNGASVQSVSWSAAGTGTVTYTDGTKESFSDCAYGCCGDNDCSGSTPYCSNSCTSSASCVQCTETSQCGTGYECTGSQCVACTTHASKMCVNNDVYWRDACGAQEDLFQDCGMYGTCSNGACVNSENAFSLSYEVTDAVFDAARNRVYVSSKTNKYVKFIDLADGSVDAAITFSYMPERMEMSPDGTKLYVALLTREHDYYWFDTDGLEGYIAEIDLNSGVKNREIHINSDPYDLVITSTGQFVVSSGSGQWTKIRSYSLTTGAEIGNAVIYNRTRLVLHPNESSIYAADTGVSPSDIEKFNLTSSSLTALYDSPYHGDHRMNGNVYVTPDGLRLITKGGDIFYSTSSQTTDMTYIQGLSTGNIEHLAFDTTNSLIYTIEGSALRSYNLSTFSYIDAMSLGATGNFVGVSGDYVYVILNTSGGAAVKRFTIADLKQ